jgi:hypothetical protein
MRRRIRRQILCSLSDLTARELSVGRPLVGRERFVERSLIKAITRALDDSKAVTEIDDQTYIDSQSFKITFEANRKAILDSLGLTKAGDKETRDILNQWWSKGQTLIDQWTVQIVNDERRRLFPNGGMPPTNAAITQSLRRFCAYHMARLVLTIGLGRAIKTGDANDARHYAYGGYVDLIVSDDGSFRDTCDLVKWEMTTIKSFDEFVSFLGC